MKHGVVLFHTTSAALRAEKLTVRAGLDVKLVPTPRELSSDCGIALRFAWGEAARVANVLAAGAVEHEVHPMPG